MFLFRIVALLPLALSLQACKDDGGSKVNSEQLQKTTVAEEKVKPANAAFDFVVPEPNLSSPDNAVKSWWALTDAIAKAQNDECKRGNPRAEAFRAARRSLATGNTKDFYQKSSECRLEDFDRTIERASVETETRAVVMANIKNVTKLPEGVSLSKYAKENVEKGIGYKYVLARESDKWYVDEVYVYNSTNVYLKKDPWQQEYKNEKNEEVYLNVTGQ